MSPRVHTDWPQAEKHREHAAASVWSHPTDAKNKILQAEKHRKHPSAGRLGGHALPGRTLYAASDDGLFG